MKRRNYLQSVASLPVLSIPSLPSTNSETEDDDEFAYNIDAVWHRGREDGHIYTDDFRYEYEDYSKWKASTVVFSSLYGFDIVPKLTRIDNTRLIYVTDVKDGYERVLLTADDRNMDISLSTHRMNQIKFVPHDKEKNYYIACGNIADVQQTIEEEV
jgi:hypothetical protein